MRVLKDTLNFFCLYFVSNNRKVILKDKQMFPQILFRVKLARNTAMPANPDWYQLMVVSSQQ